MSKIIKRINRIVSLYLSMFNKRDPQLMLFGSWWGEKFADNSKYLYLFAVNNGCNAYWITNNQAIYRELKSQNLPVALKDSKEGKELAKKAGVYFFSTALKDVNDSLCGGAVLINLWHGIPLKKIMYDNKYNNDDNTVRGRISKAITFIPTRKQYVVSTSNEVTRIYKSAFKYDNNHILQWGQPRNDCFFNGSLNRRKYADGSYKKLIVYLPTHRNEGKISININQIFDIGRLNSLCKEYDAFFMIKKHFYHKNERTDLSIYSNVCDITQDDYDAQELLFNADVLITDYSSCFIDYLLLDRPVLFYAYDYKKYLKNDREMYFDYEKIAPGSISYNFDSFYNNLRIVLENKDESSSKRNKVKNLFYDPDNQRTVSEKIISNIMAGRV